MPCDLVEARQEQKGGNVSKRVSLLALTTFLAVVFSGSTVLANQVTQEDRPVGSEELMQMQKEDRKPAEKAKKRSFAKCKNGFAGPYPCENVDLLSQMPLSDFGSESGNDIWGWTDPKNNKEYVLMGLDDGTGFVDISNPRKPVYLGKLPTRTDPSIWRDMKVYKNYAFIVSEAEGHGMQVFDLTRLRGVKAPRTWTADAVYDGFGSAHNIVINEETGFAYAVGTDTCNGGLHMIDINDPLNPTFAGCYAEDGYTHDTQVVIYQGPDEDYQGREIAFSSNEDTLTITDVTDKSNPTLISRLAYPGVGYTHQGWLTPDQRYFLLGDELDEFFFRHNTRTRIFDLQDLDAPVNLPAIYDANTAAIDHNIYTKGDYAYQANYRAGLRILDTGNVGEGQLEEVAFFDIYPPDDEAQFNGAWGNYPFFDKVVVVSGIEQGLFVLRPRL